MLSALQKKKMGNGRLSVLILIWLHKQIRSKK
jgi:hypothetical protein